MEQPADRAEAAAVTTTFRRRLKTFPVDPAYMDTEKQSDGCFVMRPRSPSRGGAIQMPSYRYSYYIQS